MSGDRLPLRASKSKLSIRANPSSTVTQMIRASRLSLKKTFACFAIFLLVATLTNVAAQPLPAYVFSSPMLPLLVQMPENGWREINANFFSDVWTPPELEPMDNGSVRNRLRVASEKNSVVAPGRPRLAGRA